MLINDDPPPGKKWETRAEHYRCPYHRENPFVPNWAGCTCSASYTRVLVDLTPEEKEKEIVIQGLLQNKN